MSEAPERIWVWWDDEYDIGVVNKHGDPRYTPTEAREYLPADLVEAAVKRALEGAAEEASVCWMDGVPYPECEDYIRRLKPAQFIDGEK